MLSVLTEVLAVICWMYPQCQF